MNDPERFVPFDGIDPRVVAMRCAANGALIATDCVEGFVVEMIGDDDFDPIGCDVYNAHAQLVAAEEHLRKACELLGVEHLGEYRAGFIHEGEVSDTTAS